MSLACLLVPCTKTYTDSPVPRPVNLVPVLRGRKVEERSCGMRCVAQACVLFVAVLLTRTRTGDMQLTICSFVATNSYDHLHSGTFLILFTLLDTLLASLYHSPLIHYLHAMLGLPVHSQIRTLHLDLRHPQSLPSRRRGSNCGLQSPQMTDSPERSPPRSRRRTPASTRPHPKTPIPHQTPRATEPQ